MPGDPNVLFSDLEAARSISQRLRAGGGPGAPEAPPFSLEPMAAPVLEALEPMAAPALEALEPMLEPDVETLEPIREAVPVPAVLWETDNLGSRFWNELLGECLSLCRVERPIAAFAVDAQGLCIAQVGDMEPDAVEGTGSRLVIALEQADRMESFADRRLGSLLLEFDDRWLTSLLLRAGSGSRVVVGIIAREPLSDATRGLVSHLLGEALLRG